MRPIWRAFIGVVAGGLLLTLCSAAAMAQDEPEVTSAPSVSGAPHVGEQLTAVGATWTGEPPLTVTYRWQRCRDGLLLICEPIGGHREPVYTIATRDLGRRLRVGVFVSNRDGDDHAWSEATAAVTAAPPPPPPPPPAPPPPEPPVAAPVADPVPVPDPQPASAADRVPTLMSPKPLVRIRGWLTPGGAMLTHLTVRSPRGASIRVRCFGRSCPRERLARTAKVTRLRSFEGRLRAGTRIVVRVTRAGFIGKYTSIRIRRGKQPARRDLCLYPGARKPVKCPAA